MGTVKYSQIATSNGIIIFDSDNLTHERNFDNYKYIKFFDVNGIFKVYINDSTDYIYLTSSTDLELPDFQINKIKVVAEDVSLPRLQYYLCK